MKNVTYLYQNKLIDDESKDFVSETLVVEELQLNEARKWKKVKLIGLGSIYLILILASFTLLS